MRLDRSICKGGHWNNRYVLGIEFEGHVIYLMEDGIYNVYRVKQDVDYPNGGPSCYSIDNDTSYYSMSLSPYFEPGNGKVFKDNLSGYTYEYAGEYKAIMSGKIKTPNDNVLEIMSIRRDTVNLSSFCSGLDGHNNIKGFTNLKIFEYEAEKFPFAPKTAGNMFRGCTSLEKVLIGCENHSLTTVDSMFAYCHSLINVNLKQFKTGNVTRMSLMFLECSSLESLDISSWNTGNLIDMSGMFWDCTSLYSLKLFKNTNKVEDMSAVFKNCSSLYSLDLSNWSTNKVQDMTEMFSGCSSLEYLNLSNWTTGAITYSNGIYHVQNILTDCSSLQELRLDNCSKRTIDMIINSEGFPTNKIYGKQRIIWCKKANTEGLTPPANWRFGYIDY